MNEHNSLYLVYNFSMLNKESIEVGSTYNIVYLFNAHGELARDLIDKTLRSLDMKANEDTISLNTKEELELFASKLVNDHGMQQIFMLSVADLNIGIDALSECQRRVRSAQRKAFPWAGPWERRR